MGWIEEWRIKKERERSEKKIRDEAEAAQKAVEEEQRGLELKVKAEKDRIKALIPMRVFQDAVDRYTPMMVAAQPRFQYICDQMNEFNTGPEIVVLLGDDQPVSFLGINESPNEEVKIIPKMLSFHLRKSLTFRVIKPGILVADFKTKDPFLIEDIDPDLWAEAMSLTLEQRMEFLRSKGIKELKDASS